MGDRTGLLTRLRTWDMDAGQVRQVDDDGARDKNLSLGLGDRDVDPDHAAYGF